MSGDVYSSGKIRTYPNDGYKEYVESRTSEVFHQLDGSDVKSLIRYLVERGIIT